MFRKNNIDDIRNSLGHWTTDSKEVADCLINHCLILLSSTGNSQPEETINIIPCLVTSGMNEQLNYEFMAWEVQVAFKQMTLLKAPGSDDMPPLFYQNYWNLVGMDVTQFVLSFLNSASLPQHLNHTFITLILKVNKPELVFEFRPISLCNVLYKIFSKVLANKLKRILPKIITTEHQSAFTKNHLISNNIMVALKTLHSMQHHNLVKDGL